MSERKIYYAIPDTPEDIRMKISALENENAYLQMSLDKMKKDLLTNHMNYGDQLIANKKVAMETTFNKIKSNKTKIENYNFKLKKLENGTQQRTTHLD